MDNEIIDLDAQGETAEVPATLVPAAEMESILVFLTTVFMILAVLLAATQLYSVYGIGKDETKSNRVRTE